nr:hypothetical protein [Tanacetum cinerariifolium]
LVVKLGVEIVAVAEGIVVEYVAHVMLMEYLENLELLSTFLTRLSKMYLEKLNLLLVDKQMIADAIAELNSFQDVRLALIDCRIVWMRNFHWLEKKAL